MIQKARFLQRQNPVTVTHIDNDTWYTICLNEQISETSYETFGDEKTEGTYTEYIYDLNQFKDNSLNEEDVVTHPEEYINYIPKFVEPVTPLNIEQRVADLEMKQEVSDQALQDVMLMVMGGE